MVNKMKNTILLLLLLVIHSSCKTGLIASTESDKKAIETTLDSWHKAAARAQFETYFSFMTSDAVFIGTDATENWKNQAFKEFSKPYFDKGKAWNFTALERNIYIGKDNKTAWFDELLDTQMKICRGSGVLIKTGSEWKIKHYVLSMTIPNDNVDEVIKIKEKLENPLIEKLKGN
jgi:SnoaL-like domain